MSPWCAWCGARVAIGVLVAEVVTYHHLCWARRARLLNVERADRLEAGDRTPATPQPRRTTPPPGMGVNPWRSHAFLTGVGETLRPRARSARATARLLSRRRASATISALGRERLDFRKTFAEPSNVRGN